MARLDNFAIELQSDPQLKGYIMFYHGRNELPAHIPGHRPERALDYLVNVRGIDAARVSVIRGGFREEQATELLIQPPDAPAPEPSGTITFDRPKGITYKYDEKHVDFASFDAQFFSGKKNGSESEVEATPAPEESAEDETVEQTPDDVDLEMEQDDVAAAPTEPDDELMQIPDAFAYGFFADWATKDYAAAVLEEEGARACVIYYADEHSQDRMPGVVESGTKLLVERRGLKLENIVIIAGGFRQSATLEMWVIPRGALLPTPTPEEKKLDEPDAEPALP